MSLRSLKQSNQIGTKQGGLTTGHAHIFWRCLDERQHLEVFLDEMTVINLFRWLRAHDAVTVASVCGENGVVRRLRPKDGPNET